MNVDTHARKSLDQALRLLMHSTLRRETRTKVPASLALMSRMHPSPITNRKKNACDAIHKVSPTELTGCDCHKREAL
jgi:hypothetical protein